MKFIVSSSLLLGQLNNISGVISSNPVVPILENFLFEVDSKKNSLTITASDLQVSMITEIQIETDSDGRIAIPAKILVDTLKNLPEQPVTFTVVEESYGVEIISENGRYKLAGENATDFPQNPTVDVSSGVNLDSDVLSKAINHTLFATSSDDLRPSMSGVYLNFDEEGVTFVSTDGHRLIRYKRRNITTGDNNNSIIIPKKGLNLLKSSLPTSSQEVNVDFNESNISFKYGNIQLYCRLIDERFPDYENVIPLDNNNHITLERHEILSSLKRISIYANKTTNQVRLSVEKDKIKISAEDLEFSNEAKETISCEHDGEDIEIGFNAKFLIEMLNNISAESVVLQLSLPNKAGLIVPNDTDEEEDLLMLIMPVMLNTYHV